MSAGTFSMNEIAPDGDPWQHLEAESGRGCYTLIVEVIGAVDSCCR